MRDLAPLGDTLAYTHRSFASFSGIARPHVNKQKIAPSWFVKVGSLCLFVEPEPLLGCEQIHYRDARRASLSGPRHTGIISQVFAFYFLILEIILYLLKIQNKAAVKYNVQHFDHF